jgi:hypothetical protein
LAFEVNLSYRLAQLWWNVTANPLPLPVRLEIETVLSPGEAALFYRCQETDQWHAYRVYRALVDSGQTEPDLLAAALLHDVGKTEMRLTVWNRILIVIVDALIPGKIEQWGRENGQGWKQPFAVRLYHPQWGAELARAAGTSDRAVYLIEHHQDELPERQQPADDQLLRRLKWADDLN